VARFGFKKRNIYNIPGYNVGKQTKANGIMTVLAECSRRTAPENQEWGNLHFGHVKASGQKANSLSALVRPVAIAQKRLTISAQYGRQSG